MTSSPWPPPSGEPIEGHSAGFAPGVVGAAWVGSYVVAIALGGLLLGSSGYGDAEVLPTWVIALSSMSLWAPQLAMLFLVSRRFGTGSWSRDFGWSFAVRDLWGIPLGLASQFILVNLVMLPLRLLFPDRFSAEDVERRARELSELATGWWFVVLVALVVFGAPIIEELVYRGMIQGGLSPRLGASRALVLAAVWFTMVHLHPVEFPGLFAFALVLGWCYMKTRTLGLAIVTHIAFNAAGLSVVALT
jgi:membrane protease YdiL (CAAX protease family)